MLLSKKYLSFLASIVGVSMCMNASAANFAGEIAAARINGTSGAELSVGARFDVGPIAITPSLSGFVYQGDNNSRYRLETQSNGTEVCRDHSNGQYAAKSNCDSGRVDGAGKIEATYRIQHFASDIGIGARIGKQTNKYLTFSVPVSQQSAIKFDGGKDYWAIGLSVLTR